MALFPEDKSAPVFHSIDLAQQTQKVKAGSWTYNKWADHRN